MELTDAQVDHFETFGFVFLPGWLQPDEVDGIWAETQAGFDEVYPPFDGKTRQWLPLLSPKAPTLCRLAEDERYQGAADRLMGEGSVLLGADANRMVGAETPWHPDCVYQGIKFIAYLDPVDASTGALRVIPGSHRGPYAAQVAHHLTAFSPPGDEVPFTSFSSRPGDVLAFDLRLWHAAFGSATDRRMSTITFYRAPSSEEDIQTIGEHLSTVVASTETTWPRTAYPFYDPEWAAQASSSPTRAKLVDSMQRARLFDVADAATTRAAGQLLDAEAR